MTPTFIQYHHNDQPYTAILGTPGGSRIITMVFLGALEALTGSAPQAWADRKRFHHQYLPDAIQHEPDTFTAEEKQALQQQGHQLKDTGRHYGNMQAIRWNQSTGKVEAASDKRRIGQSLVSE